MDRKMLWIIAGAAILVTPAIAREQISQSEGVQRQKQKAWSPANFRTRLDECALTRTPDGFAVSGSGVIDLDEDGRLDLAITEGSNGEPTVSAHAINTKGTGGRNGRMANGQACALAPSPRGTLPSTWKEVPQVATCAVSGDPDRPRLTFDIPLSVFGTAKPYNGHITLIRHSEGVAPDAEMTVIASCDTDGLTKAGQPVRTVYEVVSPRAGFDKNVPAPRSTDEPLGSAHAVNTKGTGANNNRTASGGVENSSPAQHWGDPHENLNGRKPQKD